MFVPPTFAQIVGSPRFSAPSRPQRAPRRALSRRRWNLRVPGYATALTALILAASAAFLAPSSLANSLSASEQSMDFGNQTVHTAGQPRAVLIYNDGQRGVYLDSLSFTGADADAFFVESEDCTGDSLSPHAHCIVALRFGPSRTGNLSAGFVVSSTAQPDESVGVDLTGTAVPLPPEPATLEVLKVGEGVGVVATEQGEIDCGPVCSTTFYTGDTVTLKATAAAGSEFAGWSGGGCGEGPTCSVSLSADTTVMAFFGQVTEPPKVSPPQPIAKPAIRGRRRVGARLRCSGGQWSGNGPLAFAYSWTRGGRAVSGARGTVYRVRSKDRGRKIACRVTATGPGGVVSSTSQPVRIRRP